MKKIRTTKGFISRNVEPFPWSVQGQKPQNQQKRPGFPLKIPGHKGVTHMNESQANNSHLSPSLQVLIDIERRGEQIRYLEWKMRQFKAYKARVDALVRKKRVLSGVQTNRGRLSRMHSGFLPGIFGRKNGTAKLSLSPGRQITVELHY